METCQVAENGEGFKWRSGNTMLAGNKDALEIRIDVRRAAKFIVMSNNDLKSYVKVCLRKKIKY